MQIGGMLDLLGLAVGPVTPTREWRELLWRSGLRRGGRDSSVLHRCVREFETAGRTVIGSAPIGLDGTADWLDNIGETCAVPRALVERRKTSCSPPSGARWNWPRSRLA